VEQPGELNNLGCLKASPTAFDLGNRLSMLQTRSFGEIFLPPSKALPQLTYGGANRLVGFGCHGVLTPSVPGRSNDDSSNMGLPAEKIKIFLI
jgi:hypothetical protein